MPRVVVIGAGIGGAPMAFELRERLGKAAQIDVAAELEWFQFVPSKFVGFGELAKELRRKLGDGVRKAA